MEAQGRIRQLGSREQRKRRDRVTRLLGGDEQPMRRFGPLYWAPRHMSWLIGALFMVGSACFAVGTIVAVSEDPKSSGIIFFVGSIFFTAAGYGQFLQVINGDRGEGVDAKIKLFAWEPHLIEWKAAAIQSFGTLCFNVSTGFALVEALDANQVHRLVWSPDAYGSVAFLVASWYALREESSSITWLNMVGSVFFGLSAIGAYVVPDDGTLYNAAWSNGGTFLGAVCFFLGAYLLWPEAARATARRPKDS